MVWFQLDPPGAVRGREPNPSQLPLDGHTSPSRGLCLDPESLLALRKRRQTRVQLLVASTSPRSSPAASAGRSSGLVSPVASFLHLHPCVGPDGAPSSTAGGGCEPTQGPMWDSELRGVHRARREMPAPSTEIPPARRRPPAVPENQAPPLHFFFPTLPVTALATPRATASASSGPPA